MNSWPSPTHLTIRNFPVLNIDIVWDKLEHLTFGDGNSLDTCRGLLRRAPLLKTYVLSMHNDLEWTYPPSPQTIVRHTCLRKLDICDFPSMMLIEFLDFIELPSLEEYHYLGHDVYDLTMYRFVSLLYRSGTHLKVLKLHLHGVPPAMDTINMLLKAVPSLHEFQLDIWHSSPRTAFIMDDLFLQLSSSPPVLEGGAPGFLPELKSLKLSSGEGYMFECIPDIFSLSHRKTLNLELDGSRKIVLKKDTSRKISDLIDQGFKIRLLQHGQDYFYFRSLE